MPTFAFTARDAIGQPQSGKLDARDFQAVVGTLRDRGWVVVDVRAEEPSALDIDVMKALDISQHMPVWQANIELSLRQLAVMLRSGLTLLDALTMLSEHANGKSTQRIWKQVADAILAGESFADAMAEHRAFSPVVVQLTRVGEQTGELESVLVRAADILEGRRRLRNQIMQAMAYPIVILMAAIGVAGFMVFNVIPKLATFLKAMGRQLPAMTQMLVDATDFIHANVLNGAISIVAFIILVIVARNWAPSRMWIDRTSLYVPIIGGVLRTAGTASFARNLQTLLQSGVSLLGGLKSVEQLFSNRHIALQVSEARQAVMAGKTLAESLPKHGGLTPLLGRMIAVGESSGRLDEILGEAANYYEERLSAVIRRLAALVEPAMILVVGGIVGFVYIAFFMALFAAAG